jgi:type IX secretion system PorP/SprF family membrane protein
MNYKKLKIVFSILLISWLPFHSVSQDFPYSQFYANPLYLNPALAGIEYCPRIALNYRNQWPALPSSFISYSASYDQFSDFFNGGLGLQLNYSTEGAASFNHFQLRGVYAYRLRISSETEARLALEAGFGQRSVRWENLIFSSMIDPGSGTISPSLPPPENFNGNRLYPDFATGFVVGISEKYFVGAAVHHLTSPDISFMGEGDNPLNMKITVHAGATFGDEPTGYYSRRGGSAILISPNILYQQHGDFRHVNLGSYFTLQPFVFGAWFRHAFENSDAIIISLGLQRENLRFGYSYDYTVSALSNAGGGAHEISLTWLFECSKKSKRPRAIKCPTF